MNTMKHDEIKRAPLELDNRQLYYRRRDEHFGGQILSLNEIKRRPEQRLRIFTAVCFVICVAAAVMFALRWA